MIPYKLILIPLIGFIIGYSTNYIAIKMLFHPRNKILGIQGILPKRRKQLAQRIGDVSIELIPSKLREIEKIPIIGTATMQYIKDSVENQINSLSLDELEKIVLKVAQKELRFITWIGGLIGLLIGLIQIGIFYM
jgi:uncharacterized membrane protein YheB (UPF0754 family)